MMPTTGNPPGARLRGGHAGEDSGAARYVCSVPTTVGAYPTGGPCIPRLLEPARGAVDVIYREMIKFGVVGAVAFVIDIGVFNLLRSARRGLSGTVSRRPRSSPVPSATLFAWLGNRLWTFRHRRSRPAHHEVLLFFGVNARRPGDRPAVT